MKDYDQFHDGSFDGFLSLGKTAHLFLSDERKSRWVLTGYDVLALSVEGASAGSIVFDVIERACADATAEDLLAFSVPGDPPDTREAEILLRKAKSTGMSLLEISPSYGATCVVLAEHCELLTYADWQRRQCAPGASAPTPAA